MVETQLVARGIRDERVLEAMRNVPRHAFVPGEHGSEVYGDYPFDIGYGQTISQPYIVAYMIEQLEVRPEHRVLEIGTGTGYQAALLGYLALRVTTVERIKELAQFAENKFRSLGYENIEVVVRDGTQGHSPNAPYDRIIVAAASPSVPEPLIQQLAPDGRIVIPVGDRASQDLQLVTQHGGQLHFRQLVGCRFVPLIGSSGFQP